jgi:hypothetical protein
LTTELDLHGMKTLSGFCGAALLCALTIPVTMHAQDDHRDNQRQQENNRRYHDARHNDDHEWNDHEDRAYRMWGQENHRKYNDFSRLRERDQQSYWDWRHNHSDAQLRIDIR